MKHLVLNHAIKAGDIVEATTGSGSCYIVTEVGDITFKGVRVYTENRDLHPLAQYGEWFKYVKLHTGRLVIYN